MLTGRLSPTTLLTGTGRFLWVLKFSDVIPFFDEKGLNLLCLLNLQWNVQVYRTAQYKLFYHFTIDLLVRQILQSINIGNDLLEAQTMLAIQSLDLSLLLLELFLERLA